ncbi:MAG: DUF2306 domain-containing protein [Ferruginibacter sp.]
MLKNSIRIIFWVLFFGFFLYKLIPKFSYITEGIPDYIGKKLLIDRFWFVLHITTGIIVYITGLFQFIPYIRNKNLLRHRKLGKLFIISSLLCILALYFVIPGNLCDSCRPSQYFVTSLWLLFVLLAFYFIKQRKIALHQRFMTSGFICAAYFVTVRLIDMFAMDFFFKITKNESDAFLFSDIAAWLVPLSAFWSYWFVIDRSKRTTT